MRFGLVVVYEAGFFGTGWNNSSLAKHTCGLSSVHCRAGAAGSCCTRPCCWRLQQLPSLHSSSMYL